MSLKSNRRDIPPPSSVVQLKFDAEGGRLLGVTADGRTFEIEAHRCGELAEIAEVAAAVAAEIEGRVSKCH